jgi:hypothetical protein
MFVVVCFFGTSEVDVAPNAWIVATESGDVCCWPPYKTTQRLVKAKISCESPTSQWERYAVKIMYGPAGMVHLLMPYRFFFHNLKCGIF